MTKFKKLILVATLVSVFMAAWSVWWYNHVSMVARSKIERFAEVKPQKVALLLGTSKYAKGGRINLYYQYRIEAVAKLYAAGKIDYVLVSGDNSTVYYNEPTTMLNDLIAKGIPADRIVQDFAGFRTLDSVVRAKKVFGQTQFIIVSQLFHVERALFIARKKGIQAKGFCAQDVTASYGFKTKVREYFARVKMFIDLYLINKEPKFLGDPVQIPSSSNKL